MKIALALAAGLLASPATAALCRVVGVSDGDTITVRCGEAQPLRVRLAGIDCPEKRQAFGKKAKARTAELAMKQDVDLKDLGKDRYGRTLGEIKLPDGRMLNHLLVAEGLAWHYTKYSKDATLARLEDAAKKGRLGLWAEKATVAPWTFRSAAPSKGESR